MLKRRIKSGLIALALLAPSFVSASGASLLLISSKNTVAPGETFSLSVLVASESEAMNAASGVLVFPKDKLEAISIQKGALFNFWLKEPGYSNQQGKANFEGIVLNPGYKGKAGKIITIAFRAKAVGTAQISISNGEVLANDGKGTNILSGLGKLTINVKEAAVPTTVSAAQEPAGSAGRLLISTTTHPDPDKWYADRNFRIEWTQEGVTDISFILDGNPETLPPHKAGLKNSFEAKYLNDGTHYFHLAYRDKGGWQKTMHIRFLVDSSPPENVRIDFLEGKETFSPPRTIVSASDGASGISGYKLKVGDQDWVAISKKTASETFLLPIGAPGRQSVVLTAFDQAGNSASVSDEIILKPIKEPVLDSLDRSVSSEDFLRIGGFSAKDGKVVIWIGEQGGEAEASIVMANSEGRFFHIADHLEPGNYDLWAQAEDGRGAKSNPTGKIFFEVKKPLVSDGTIKIIILTSLFLLLILAAFGRDIFSVLSKSARKKWREIKKISGPPTLAGINNTYAILHDNITRQIRHLEKIEAEMGLMEKEERTLGQLKEEVKNIEKYIRESR